MNTVRDSLDVPITLRQLGQLAQLAIIETERRLNHVEPWDIEPVRSFLEATRDSPFSFSSKTEETARLVGTKNHARRRKAPAAAEPNVDILDIPLSRTDREELWRKRWELSVRVYSLAVQDGARPESSRNTWFARLLSI
ncbi:hypothetical protein MTBLM5_20089 [Magnetospirillum sp. LM-5]|uniref:hypothetical protein n=1 Tax=Magnetospirillum sp. LM-5 TaxID=2681466 RepID=UPI00137DC59A|nr:hypothetical protein [Magnetospirillum sp. LM-5]CAA7616465.1 hypothetical protein MTBLM5_20089 [Magnetospirillum sp. LM-5]